MVPAATAASTGIKFVSRNWPDTCDFYYFLISNAKAIKPAVTVGPAERWKT
jgi:hypothetical protein